MTKTISSLAILKVNWDHLKKDYLENFLPFIATLIKKKNYRIIDDVNKICTDFCDEFGLVIPYYPMIAIINRATKRGLIRKSAHKFIPVMERIDAFDMSIEVSEQLRKYEKIIAEFIKFAARYGVTITLPDANAVFISFLREHDLEILFAAQSTTILPEVKASKKEKFLLYNFIKNSYESEPEVFNFIIAVAVGHVLAGALLYNAFDEIRGKFKKIDCYFDTPFTLRLLGLNGDAKKAACVELVKTLIDEKANLRIFNHTYDEVMGILNSCLMWMDNPKYDPTLASPACRYFVENNYKSSDVERFIVNVDKILQGYEIAVVDTPDPNEYKKYQIDEDKLSELIVDIYTKNMPTFEESEKSFTIQRDIKSISAIYNLRKGIKPRSIKEARAIFITTNAALALASSRFELLTANGSFILPTCLTDIFVGTIIWLESPAKVASLNEKKIIAECYAALQPDNLLIKKFLQEVEKLKKEGDIGEDEYYLLRSHRIAMDLLAEKTLGDHGAFTDRTAEEIMEEIRARIKSEEGKRYLEEKERHEKTQKELIIIKDEKDSILINIDKRAEQIAKMISASISVILLIFFIAGMIVQFTPTVFDNQKILRIASILAAILFGIASVYSSFNIKGFRAKIKFFIKNKITDFIKGKY